MIDRPDERDQRGEPPDVADLPSRGEEILAEVERLKHEPVRFRCFGMSAGALLALGTLVGLLWLALR